MSTTTIHPVSFKEVDELSPLVLQFYSRYKDKDKLLRKDLRPSEIHKVITDNLKHKQYKYFIARTGSKPVGYLLCAYGVAPEASIEKRLGHIINIYVSNNFRKKEIGRQLLRRAFNWLKKNQVGFCSTSVAEKNKQVVSFFQKEGFGPHTHQLLKNLNS